MLSPNRSHALTALAAAAAIALGGCGGGGGGGGDKASSPLDEALGYLPHDAGFAFVASTDTGDYADVQKIVEKFPLGGRAEDALKRSFEQGGLDFDKEVKPLLGNEAVIGTPDNTSFLDSSSDTPFVLALETEDAGKLEDLIKGHGKAEGQSEGYDIFQREDGGSWAAIKDAVVVLSDDEATLKAALKQRGEDDRLTEDDLDGALEDLPADAPLRVYVNVKALLAASPQAKDALKIKWIDHLETLGLTADATKDRVSLEYSLRTDPDGLSDADLPLATGSEAPQLLERKSGSAEVALGLRDPSQLVDFGIAAAKAINPAGYVQFQTGKKTVGRRLGIDVDRDVLAQLTGNVAAVVTIDGHFGVRAELEDAKASEATLAKVMKGLPQFSNKLTVTAPKKGDRFYGLATGNGRTYAVGVAGGNLVIADQAGLASEVATRDLVDAHGQEGAFIEAADAEQIANAALAKFAGGLEGLGGSLFTGPLGDLLSSASASTDGIRGKLELEIQ